MVALSAGEEDAARIITLIASRDVAMVEGDDVTIGAILPCEVHVRRSSRTNSLAKRPELDSFEAT